MNQQCVEFHIMPDTGNLRITLLPEGRNYFFQEDNEHDDDYMLTELLEYHMCNGWNWLLPEQIGALTDSPIIAWGVVEDDKYGVGADKDTLVWWFPNYMVTSPARELCEKGVTFFIASSDNMASQYYSLCANQHQPS